MTIVDTTVWVDYLRGVANPHTDWLDRELSQQRLGLPDLILCEILRGIRGNSTFKRVRRDLSKFEIFNTGGEQLAVASAQNYRSLRAGGHTIRKTTDCMVATFCLANGHFLLHRNQDFDPFEKYLGLRVVHP
jgi:predicted nucleic acid-binding protein